MEDYEKFCEMHRARIRGEPAQSSLSLSAQRDSIPCIRFNGVPVLSPLLTLEKKKELQQDRRKALDLELWRQNSRKQVLLHRVQEILENVQMKKSPNPSDLDQSEMENVHSGLDSMNGFVPQSNGVLSSSPAACGSMEPQKALEVKPADAQVASRRNLLEGNPQFVPPKQKDACRSLAGNGGLLSGSVDRLPSNEAAEQECVEMVSAAEGGPDPYVMSLQNLLKKSREYIQREQTRRSLRVGSKRSVSESHSDKENDAVKMGSSVKERGKPTGRSSITAVAVEKPALTRSSTSPQGASLSKTSTSLAASPSFSKVDIPMRSGTPPVLDSDSDEDLKTTSLFDRDSSILRSLTGSYSKLPSPEPSMSPKMHRRRPRPSSMGHIVINNPVNAYELSPRDKERAADGVTQDVGDKRAASDPVPRLASDFALVSSRKEHAFHKSSSDITDELVVRKLSHGYQGSGGQRETREFPASAIAEGNLISAGPRLPNACLGNPTSQEPPASGYPVVSQNTTSVGAAKQVGLPDKAKPAELNKSYDVESPSPLLLQIQHSPQIDTPGNEQALELGFEKVKRRLELDAESVPKESVPCAVAEGTREPGRHSWLRDQRGPVGSAFAADGTPDRGNYEEEALKQKMLALEELRKRLEAQHVQQLSLLIAEQEMEQERLQKEIAMQERRLKGEEAAAVKTDVPQIALNSGMELGWRKISDAHVLESVRTQAGTVHSAHLESAGFANVTGPGLTADAPFYLWDPPASGKSVSASRSLSRSKMRWSQVYSPEMKRKLDKISALAKGFLTRRLLQTEKLKHLSQTVKDTMEFIKNFQSEAPLKRGAVSAQDANLQERVVAQLRAALYDIHDIFFKMEVSERMNILRHDREVRKEKMLRQLDKAKALRERVTLSTATQKSLDRKKYMKAAEMGMPNKKTIVKQKTPENRVLQPNQGQNAPIQRLLSRQGSICRKNPKKEAKCCDNLRRQHSLG